MNPNILTGIVFAVFALVLSSALYATHRHGYSSCQKEHTEAALVAGKRASTKLEKIQNETQKMEPDAIDADLVRLNIVRESSDR